MTLGEKLKQARKAAGMTKVKLAAESGVSASTIHNYECDACEPSFFYICCLAQVLKLPLEYLSGARFDIDGAKLNKAISTYYSHTQYYIPRDDAADMQCILEAASLLSKAIY